MSPGKLVPPSKLSLAAVNVVAAGVAGAVVSIVIDSPLEASDVLPAKCGGRGPARDRVHAVGQRAGGDAPGPGRGVGADVADLRPVGVQPDQAPRLGHAREEGRRLVAGVVVGVRADPRVAGGSSSPPSKLSLAAVNVGRARRRRRAGAVVSIVIDSPLEASDVLPAKSVAVAVIVYTPSASVLEAMLQAPVVASASADVADLRPVGVQPDQASRLGQPPVKVGVLSLV